MDAFISLFLVCYFIVDSPTQEPQLYCKKETPLFVTYQFEKKLNNNM